MPISAGRWTGYGETWQQGVPKVEIAIVPDDPAVRADYLADRLPARYMDDFSMLGLVVDHHRQALAILAESGFLLERRDCGVTVCLTSPDQLPEIVGLLARRAIRCELADIADTIYQA